MRDHKYVLYFLSLLILYRIVFLQVLLMYSVVYSFVIINYYLTNFDKKFVVILKS